MGASHYLIGWSARQRLLASAALLSLLATPAVWAAGFLEGRQVEQRYRYEGVSRLTIEGEFLDVRVFGTARTDIEVALRVSARMMQRNEPVLVLEDDPGGTTMHLGLNMMGVSRASRAWGPQLVIAVPERLELDIRTTSGDVTVQGMDETRISVDSVVGAIFVAETVGVVVLASEEGRISAQRLSGTLDIRGATGDVEVVGMRGDVWVRGGAGAVAFRGVEGDIWLAAGVDAAISEHRGTARDLASD